MGIFPEEKIFGASESWHGFEDSRGQVSVSAMSNELLDPSTPRILESFEISPLQTWAESSFEISSFKDQPWPPVPRLAIHYATYRALKDFAFEKRASWDRYSKLIVQNSTS